MTYRVEGLNQAQFQPYFAMSDEELLAYNARHVVAGADMGFPCRVSLQDARAGEALLLIHHISHDVMTPYRSAYAIFVREAADQPACYIDSIPPVFEGRPIALRAFDSEAMLKTAALALPGQTDAKICELLERDDIAYIDAHNAAHGCFSARINRC